MNNLSGLLQALPQVLRVLGTIQSGDLTQYVQNVCKTQNIPLEPIVQQARGIINLMGEDNIRRILNQNGLNI